LPKVRTASKKILLFRLKYAPFLGVSVLNSNTFGQVIMGWWQFLYKPALSDEGANALIEAFGWALQHFDRQRFVRNTPLVLPTADFFPAQLSSPQAAMRYAFEQVTRVCGLPFWPWRLGFVDQCPLEPPPLLGLNVMVRDDNTLHDWQQAEGATLWVPVIPDQLSQPAHLVANFAQTVAQHLLWQSQLVPPGGPESFKPMAELLAIFMGFGVMMTQSAYHFRGSCARCVNPAALRQASLSESETLFALAIFCRLKQIPRQQVLPHLKRHLAGAYKSAEAQLERHPGLAHLRQLMT
jgi:hypothetical protein